MIPISNILQQRPLLWVSLAFGSGIVSADYWFIPLKYLWFSIFTSGLLLYLGLIKHWFRPSLVTIFYLLLFAFLGALRYTTVAQSLPANHISHTDFYNKKVLIRGRVTAQPEQTTGHMRFALAVEAIETDSLFAKTVGRVLCNAYKVTVPVDLGDYLVLRGRLKKPQPARNPGGYDQQRFLTLQGIYGLIGIYQIEQIIHVEARPGYWWDEWFVLPVRRSIQQTIERNLSGTPAGLLRGMLLGEKYRIPYDTRDRFRMTGLAHTLVISGLHVGLIAVFFFSTLKICQLPDRWTALLTIVVLAYYALLTELQAPVVRAVLMTAIVLLGRCLGRQGEIYNSLGLAALVISVVWPSSLLGLSFQLSFGATLSIVVLHRPLTHLWPLSWRQRPWLNKGFIDPFCVSMAAQLGTGPLLAYHFQHFAPISLLANLVVVPLLGVTIGLGVLAALTGAWCPLIATVFNGSNFLVLKSLIALVDFCSTIPYGSLATPRPDLFFVVCAAVLCLLLSHTPIQLGARKAALFLLMCYLNWAVWSQVLKPYNLEVVFFDVGQGDAAFVRCPNGRTLIIDGGEANPYYDYGQRVLLPFLRQRHINRIDIVIASHPHSDHVGGLVSLLTAIEVGHYLDAGQYYDSHTMQLLATLIHQHDIQYHAVTAGDSLIGLGGVEALVLHPGPAFVAPTAEAPYGLNNGSIVLRLQYGTTRLLFTGDIEKDAEPALIRWGERLQADVLKVPHHGSQTSSQAEFIDAVKPQLAVISVGAFNTFRHPALEILTRYKNRGAKVLRTDQHGAILLHSNGKTIYLQTMLEMNNEIIMGNYSTKPPDNANIEFLSKSNYSDQIHMAVKNLVH